MKELPFQICKCLLIFPILFIFLYCRKTPEAKKVTQKPEFVIEETTIAKIHAAMMEGEISCRQLVEKYLDRIDAYDQSTGLNAIVVINPNALERAEELDREFAKTGKLRPLHGIPIIVKDNYETKNLQTTAGSLALKGFIPSNDAFQVRKIKEDRLVCRSHHSTSRQP